MCSRVKALVSILTPRNHALANPPAFIEFDFALEGFSSLFIPSLVNWDLATKNQLNSDQQIGKPSLLTVIRRQDNTLTCSFLI